MKRQNKFILIFIGSSLLILLLLIILPLIHWGVSREDVITDFFQGLEKEDIEKLDYIFDGNHAGYRIYAKVRLKKESMKKILTGTEMGSYKCDTNDTKNVKAWRLISKNTHEEFIVNFVMGRLNPLQCKWWNLSDLSQVDIYMSKGSNALTFSFTHWWLVPHNEDNVVYLIGSGS